MEVNPDVIEACRLFFRNESDRARARPPPPPLPPPLALPCARHASGDASCGRGADARRAARTVPPGHAPQLTYVESEAYGYLLGEPVARRPTTPSHPSLPPPTPSLPPPAFLPPQCARSPRTHPSKRRGNELRAPRARTREPPQSSMDVVINDATWELVPLGRGQFGVRSTHRDQHRHLQLAHSRVRKGGAYVLNVVRSGSNAPRPLLRCLCAAPREVGVLERVRGCVLRLRLRGPPHPRCPQRVPTAGPHAAPLHDIIRRLQRRFSTARPAPVKRLASSLPARPGCTSAGRHRASCGAARGGAG